MAKIDDGFAGRVMPAIGLDYRYPFVANFGALGVHTLEPIGQIIARPSETRIGRLPNEDAQSLVFDDTSLFEWDKFSGYDRVEGGAATSKRALARTRGSLRSRRSHARPAWAQPSASVAVAVVPRGRRALSPNCDTSKALAGDPIGIA